MYISLSRPTSICIIELDGEVKPRPRRYAFLKSRLSKNLTTKFHSYHYCKCCNCCYKIITKQIFPPIFLFSHLKPIVLDIHISIYLSL